MYINFLEMSSGLELHKKANPRAQYGVALWMDTQGSTQLPQVHWSHNVSSWQFWACSFLLQIDPLRKRITTVNISMFTKRITVTRFLIKNCPQWSWLGLYHILFCTPQHLPQCQDKALQISGKMGAGLNRSWNTWAQWQLASFGSSTTAANLRPCGIPAVRNHWDVDFERDVHLICPTAR